MRHAARRRRPRPGYARHPRPRCVFATPPLRHLPSHRRCRPLAASPTRDGYELCKRMLPAQIGTKCPLPHNRLLARTKGTTFVARLLDRNSASAVRIRVPAIWREGRTGPRGMGRWGLLLLTVLLACETPATADRERAKAGAYRGCQVAGALCGDGAAAGSLGPAPSACLPRAARWRLELRGGKQGGAVGKSTTGCSPVCTPCPTDSGLLCGTDETRRFVGGDGSEVCACGFPCFSCPRAPVPSDAPTVHRAL